MEDSRQTLNRDDAAAQILLDGLSDWVALGMAQQYVRDQYPSASRSRIREETLNVVDWLLTRGLVVAGDVAPDFVAWSSAPEESIEAIREAWTDPEAELLPGDVCWLSTTTAGDALAERLRDGGTTTI